jgi:hypothetical protein
MTWDIPSFLIGNATMFIFTFWVLCPSKERASDFIGYEGDGK